MGSNAANKILSKTNFILSTSSEKILNSLNGLLCIYKPSGVTSAALKDNIRKLVCDELNSYDVREPKNYVSIQPEPNGEISVEVKKSYADHINVTGPRYLEEDIEVQYFAPCTSKISGVTVLGINKGNYQLYLYRKQNQVKTYQISGILGQITDTAFIDGKVLDKAKYTSLKRSTFDNLLGTFQAGHLRKMYLINGADMRSQEAYELAVQGPFRPISNDLPFVYSFKCLEFDPPHFKMELKCVNENENYLLGLIRDFGLKLKCFATTTGIRCIRNGCFHVDHSLLLKDCNLQGIIDNINLCHKLLCTENIDLKTGTLNLVPLSSKNLSDKSKG